VREDFAGIAGDRAITLSAGIAFAAPDEPLEDAMRRADAALYAAKQAGRDRIAIACGDDDVVAPDAPGGPDASG
jgi:GGDEF domain-containing protein